MNRIASAILWTASLSLLAACSTEGELGPHPRGGGGDERAQRGAPNLFISPAGKPYRAERGQPYPVVQWFAAANTSHDGHLTREQFRADAAAFFKELDTDHNGVIDGFEIQHYERVIAPEINPQIEGLRFGEGMDLALGREDSPKGAQIGRSPTASGREQAGDRRAEGAGVFGLLNEPEPVADTDANFDSHITLSEFLAAADRRFDVLDTKKLGYLTLETLPKTPVQVLLQHAPKRRSGGGPPK
jgi:hypothetical protein